MCKLMFMRMNIVEAIPMTRGEYIESKGLSLIPGYGKEEEDGYKVVYADGYVSWCPKDKFDAVSIPCADGCVPFGYAITECVYHGKRITRKGWNGEGQFVRFEDIMAFEDGKVHTEENNPGVGVESQCLVFHFKNRHTGETGVQVGWLASQGDMKANDWQIIE